MALPSAPFGGFYPQLRSLCSDTGALLGRKARGGSGCSCPRLAEGAVLKPRQPPVRLCASQARPEITRPGIAARPPSRRETIFCGPRRRELTSFSCSRRRSRLAATPRGVSVTERQGLSHGGRGRRRNGGAAIDFAGFSAFVMRRVAPCAPSFLCSSQESSDGAPAP